MISKGPLNSIEALAHQLEYCRKFHTSLDLMLLQAQCEELGYTIEEVEIFLEAGIKPKIDYDY